LLWPAVMIMVCVSMTEFFIQYKVIWRGLKTAWRESCKGLLEFQQRRGKTSPFLEKHAKETTVDEDDVEDFALAKDQVRTWEWGLGLIVTLIITCVILGVQYDMNVGLSLLASFLAIVFAFLAIQCGAVTDVTPLTAAAKASQLVFGGVTANSSGSIASRQTVNLIAGAVASAGADMGAALTSDFRVGFLLRTPPRKQWYAQAIGTLIAVFLAPGIFLLFMTAYPCIFRPDDYETCPFSAPSVAAWKAVAEAVTLPSIAIPTSCIIFSCVMGAVGVTQTLVRNYYLVGEREKWRVWLPNWMAVALGWIIPQTVYSTAMLMGATFAHFWVKKYPNNFDTYCYAIAAGMIAGEGFGGVVGAVLTIAGVDGDVLGTGLGCPANMC